MRMMIIEVWSGGEVFADVACDVKLATATQNKCLVVRGNHDILARLQPDPPQPRFFTTTSNCIASQRLT